MLMLPIEIMMTSDEIQAICDYQQRKRKFGGLLEKEEKTEE